MKESYIEDIANHYDLESCVDNSNVVGEALTEAHAGRATELRNQVTQEADIVVLYGKQHKLMRYGKSHLAPAESKTSSMHGNSTRENRETLSLSSASTEDRDMKVRRLSMSMYDNRESDRCIVPAKQSNKTSKSWQRRLWREGT